MALRGDWPISTDFLGKSGGSTSAQKLITDHARYWYAWPSTHIGHELIAAGMLIMAGAATARRSTNDELERWTRVGYERGMRSRKGER